MPHRIYTNGGRRNKIQATPGPSSPNAGFTLAAGFTRRYSAAMTITPEIPTDHRESGRLVSLDAFRGATIAAMLLVNNHMVWSFPPVPAQLLHVPWHGCTLTDFIFPFFLFIVGVAMPYSDAKRVAAGDGRAYQIAYTARRAMILFAIGVFLQSVGTGKPVLNMEVLQRIAVCAFAAAFVLRSGTAVQVGSCFALYAAYWILMVWVGVSGTTWPEGWDPGKTLAERVDLRILGRTNNEGLISTLPAITSVIGGILAGRWLRSNQPSLIKVWGLAGAGLLAAAAGYVLGGEASPLYRTNILWMPLNKILWTPSYALWTAGWAAVVLGALYFVMDVVGFRAWARPFVIYGSNAIGVYAFTRLFVMWFLIGWKVPKDGISLRFLQISGNRTWPDTYPGELVPFKNWFCGVFQSFYQNLGLNPDPRSPDLLANAATWASLTYSFMILGIGFLFCLALWRRRIFFKV